MNKTNAVKKRESKIKLTADGVQNLTILAIFVAIIIVGTILKPDLFFSGSNFMNIAVSTSSIIITGAAVTMVLISGNLDLSVGGVGAMGGVLFGLLCIQGVPMYLAMVLAMAAGAGFGLLSGYSIARFGLPSFVISLAFNYICRGIALIGAEGAVVFNLPTEVENIAQTIGGIPLPVVYALISVLIFMFIQSKTTFGAKNYAVGANLKAAKLSGINDKRVTAMVFMFSGIVAAFSGILLTSRFSAADSGVLQELHSDAIIAAVLGGTDINGGRGTVFGMLIGALFVGVLTNIMNLHDMANYVQSMVRGAILIAAIIMNNFIRSKVRV